MWYRICSCLPSFLILNNSFSLTSPTASVCQWKAFIIPTLLIILFPSCHINHRGAVDIFWRHILLILYDLYNLGWVCQKNEWNILCLEASHRLKFQHSEEANLQSGVRDVTESILTWTKHKLRLMHCPSPSCWTLGHVTFFVIEPSRKIGPLFTSLPLCPAAKDFLFSWNGDTRPDLCCCNSCCIVSALERLWANSQQLLEIPTAHFMHNNLERCIWVFRGVLWFPSRTIIAVNSRIDILSSHMQEWSCLY